MKYFIFVIILLLAGNCLGQMAQWYADDDAWDLVYFESATLGTLFLNRVVGLSYWRAFGITVALCLLKEIGDELAHEIGVRRDHWFWDARGGSFIWSNGRPGDLLRVGFTIPLSFCMRKK